MEETLALIGLIALAALFDYTNGFHDSANAIATVVATRVLRPRWAVAWAAGWNFLAFFLVGTAVADTIGSTLRAGTFSPAVVFAALLGAVAWNFASWQWGLPTSSSHALVGGLVGAGLVAGGAGAVRGASLEKTAVFIVISPVAGLLLGGAALLVLRLVLHGSDVPTVERRFRGLQLVSSAAVSLGHGGNDAQKTMGVVSALLVATGHLSARADGTLPVPTWVALGAYAAIAAGTMSGGWRIVRTMGRSITELRPVSGFAAETAAAVALFGSTALGAPVSTTHTVAGAITGVGATNRGSRVDWRVFGRLVIAWVITLPAAAAVAALTYALATLPPPGVAGVLLTVLLVVLLGLLVRAVRRAPGAGDVVDPLPGDSASEEVVMPMRPGAGSIIHAHGGCSCGDPLLHGASPSDAVRVRQRLPL